MQICLIKIMRKIFMKHKMKSLLFKESRNSFYFCIQINAPKMTKKKSMASSLSPQFKQEIYFYLMHTPFINRIIARVPTHTHTQLGISVTVTTLSRTSGLPPWQNGQVSHQNTWVKFAAPAGDSNFLLMKKVGGRDDGPTGFLPPAWEVWIV